MNIRSIIFDVYNTLLDVGPPPPDADVQWQHLCLDTFHTEPRLSRLQFSVAVSRIIARYHEDARNCGIHWPEIHWPSVVKEVFPELLQLTSVELEEFIFRHIQTGHTLRMTADTVTMLRWLKERKFMVGIASNAQAYTLRELQDALLANSLAFDMFTPDICFWSFKHGFSKPDPHVFRILTARLGGMGVLPGETMMVGDRLDNDIEPARAHGWQTWQLGSKGDGSWEMLCKALAKSQPNVEI